MDKKFDYSEFDLGKLTYHFAELTPEQADEKRALYEQFVREKEEAKRGPAKEVTPPAEATIGLATTTPKRPVFRPTAKPAAPPETPVEPANSEGSSIEHPLTDATPDEMQQIAQGGLEAKKKPVFRPTQKPPTAVTDVPNDVSKTETQAPEAKPDPVQPVAKPAGFRPTMKPPVAKAPETVPDVPIDSEPEKAKPAFRPTMKPPKVAEIKLEVQTDGLTDIEPPKPKPVAFRPTMKPAKPVEPEEQPDAPKPKPAAFRPTMKPKSKPDDETSA